MEHQLYEHFFPGDASPEAGDSGGLEALMEPLCTVLYDALRPQFILLQQLDDLCELVDILKHEVIAEAVCVNGPHRVCCFIHSTRLQPLSEHAVDRVSETRTLAKLYI